MHVKYAAGTVLAVTSTLVSGVQWAGVNIAGFDFGCDIQGNCKQDAVTPPLGGGKGGDGPGQMQHFAKVDKFNIFRLPVGWQYLANDQLGQLDEGNFATYDQLVQACLKTGAHCIIDIHNYARWNGQIIGEGGPSPDVFADLWKKLTQKYADEEKVVMGLVNEPHDLKDINAWATGAVQQAVDAIRGAESVTHTILIPGDGFTGAHSLIDDGSAAALLQVKDPKNKLVYDVHQYFDEDSSGTSTTCVDKTSIFTTLGTWLQSHGQKALISETGGGPKDESCLKYVCEALKAVRGNDAYLGWVGWAAGSFDSSYTITETPNADGSDVPLVKQCIAGLFNRGSGGDTSVTGGQGGGQNSSDGTTIPAASTTSPPPGTSSTAPKSTTCKPGKKRKAKKIKKARIEGSTAPDR